VVPLGRRPITWVQIVFAAIRQSGYHGGRIGWPMSRIPLPRFRKVAMLSALSRS
jgi:hypothetical protein